MPLYEYQCDACAHRFEVIQKFSDAPIDVCPKCGGAVKKLLSSPAIQFKGSGWYITDYAKSGKTESGGTESANAAKAEAKSEAKSEAKTDTKTETKTDTKTETKSDS
jgi:putative FmdB family regulatory protein